MKARRLAVSAQDVADSWGKNYAVNGPACRDDKRAIYHKLCELPVDAPMSAIDDAIGNDSWTTTYCCGCGKSILRSEAIQVGDEPDYESQTATLCFPCLREAYHLMPAPLQEEGGMPSYSLQSLDTRETEGERT